MAFSIEKELQNMHNNRAIAKVKGDHGEKAVLAILQKHQRMYGGDLMHSFSYPTVKGVDGNVKYIDGEFKVIQASVDEIDILYITDYKVFAIEVKARQGKWKLYDYWVNGKNGKEEKSPVTQTEKHVRHLYNTIWELIPDGDESYIVPMLVFVDKSNIYDDRSKSQQEYVRVAVLNNLYKSIVELNKVGKYKLDRAYITEKLMQIGRCNKF